MKRALLVLVVVLSGCLGATSATDGDGSVSVQAVNESELEQLIHEEVNEVRQAHGKESLAFDTELRTIARYQSEDMATEDYFAHIAPDGETVLDRYERFEYDCEGKFSSGENIAYTFADGKVQTKHGVVDHDYNESSIAKSIVTGWMGSQAHRENLLHSAWSVEAIGVITTDTEQGTKVLVTQNFC